jgi:hypothetical protein
MFMSSSVENHINKIHAMHSAARVSLPEYDDIPEFFNGYNVMDWVSLAVKSGLSQRHAINITCSFFKTKRKDANLITSESNGLWVEQGYYCKDDECLYVWDFCVEVCTKRNIGLLVGNRVYIQSNNRNIHDAVLGLFADVGLEIMSSRDVVDIQIKDRFMSYRIGTRIFPHAHVGLSSLDASYASSKKIKFFASEWSAPILSAIKHVEGRKAGRVVLLAGDYTSEITPLIESKVGALTLLELKQYSENVTYTAHDIVLVNLESLTKESILYFNLHVDNSDAYFLILSTSGNITHLVSRLLQVFNAEQLIRLWGMHFIRKAIPKLCDTCKKQEVITTTYDEPNVTVSIQPKVSYELGLGCDDCAKGHKGIVFASEHVPHSAMIEILTEALAASGDDDSMLSGLKLSPYSVATMLYKKDDITSLSKSIEAIFNHGEVQKDDIDGLLN